MIDSNAIKNNLPKFFPEGKKSQSSCGDQSKICLIRYEGLSVDEAN